MEQLLSRAANELAIRSEVQATLTTLLQDVEHAHNLEQTLRSHNEVYRLREQLEALQVRYDDREAAWLEDKREKERLGRVLLEQIVQLSAREVEGEKSRVEMKRRMQKLEEEKKMAVERNLINVKKTDGAEVADKKEEATIKQNDLSQASTFDEKDQKAPEANGNKPTDEGNHIISDTTTTEDEKKVEGSDKSNNETIQKLVPHDLNDTTLMTIVEYSDPLDVMNFAQTNKALLRKVNIMFGMASDDEGEGSSSVDPQQQSSASGGGDAAPAQTQAPAQEQAPATSMEKTEPPPSSQRPPLPSSTAASSAPPTSSVSSTEAKTTATSTPSRSSPKLSGMPGPTHKRQGSGGSVATTASARSASSTNPFPFSNVSSWFGGKDDASTTSSSAPTATTASSTTTAAAAAATTTSTTTDTGAAPEIKLNAAMANSMASKLTPAELSIILRMRERLQKCEHDAAQWKREREDALGNLASVEAVKEFLVNRVRDTEKMVQTQKEEMELHQNKHLEDQEVIVFLDEKVKELETSLKDMKSKEAETQQHSLDRVAKHEKKSRVLSDMLQFEREQMASNEKEWKAARKVLVKEVKSCRAKIVALESELEGCRQQNGLLKQGLMGISQTGSPGVRKKNMRW
eukprot:CAMPEP_0183715502 /NCGR_PEP_ID=MMETSP0737-20130205/9687_1 /TAXON_ID=385413 /ORGANISM="Thalassiosira miniscula, Strain CCMP1093" /LENGTH=630 /DNA_ID=CAMNT_0025944597 /DNA_START=14 /DNA_END=1906 /DNA_ORIENTATION=-